MIEHLVALHLAPDHDAAKLRAVMQGLAGLTGRIEGMIGFAHGPNRDFEGRSAPYGYGFVARFADVRAHHAYLEDPGHKALGAELTALCAGGAQGILVVDLDTGSGTAAA